MAFAVGPLRELSLDALAPLIAESERDGWRFVRRLADEWAAGTNRFDGPGEALFVARESGSIIGVCGLNADPYAADGITGRVRRLYVLRAYRGRGVGRQLVRAVLAAARGRFQRLRVRTESPDAGRLYRRLGFQPAAGETDCTHTLELGCADADGNNPVTIATEKGDSAGPMPLGGVDWRPRQRNQRPRTGSNSLTRHHS